ncbi:hypothetical protein ANCDUO_02758 [Ancylostoma duodenale]|uniref:Uncharacterized protein n=1 Tax=Ancylostoma duodenale TaxID=51022 RepID=A0A0C2GZL0_9BILA|nr:hypothetical protein ANCDUO_02758 [Ancylostoma duodenale]
MGTTYIHELVCSVVLLCCRVKTRIQRADTRLDIDGIRSLIDELLALPCDQQSLVEELEN